MVPEEERSEFPEEGIDFVKWDLFEVVVKIHMVGSGNDEKFLVVSGQFFEGILAEVAGMGLFSMNQEAGGADFTAVSKKRSVEKRQDRGLVPALIRVQRAGMITAGCLVIGEIILDKLGCVFRQDIRNSACGFIGAFFCSCRRSS